LRRCIFTDHCITKQNPTIMGKGDRRTRRGKIRHASYGVYRAKKKKNAAKQTAAKPA
jgi:ribosomal small subunit protein bTHX